MNGGFKPSSTTSSLGLMPLELGLKLLREQPRQRGKPGRQGGRTFSPFPGATRGGGGAALSCGLAADGGEAAAAGAAAGRNRAVCRGRGAPGPPDGQEAGAGGDLPRPGGQGGGGGGALPAPAGREEEDAAEHPGAAAPRGGQAGARGSSGWAAREKQRLPRRMDSASLCPGAAQPSRGALGVVVPRLSFQGPGSPVCPVSPPRGARVLCLLPGTELLRGTPARPWLPVGTRRATSPPAALPFSRPLLPHRSSRSSWRRRRAPGRSCSWRR